MEYIGLANDLICVAITVCKVIAEETCKIHNLVEEKVEEKSSFSPFFHSCQHSHKHILTILAFVNFMKDILTFQNTTLSVLCLIHV